MTGGYFMHLKLQSVIFGGMYGENDSCMVRRPRRKAQANHDNSKKCLGIFKKAHSREMAAPHFFESEAQRHFFESGAHIYLYSTLSILEGGSTWIG